MLHTVLFSGGLGSAYVAEILHSRGIQPLLLHTDTHWETPDTYQFMEVVSERVEGKLLYRSDGRTPEQLFWDKHLLGNNRMPVCSDILKTKQTMIWLREMQLSGQRVTLYFGILGGEQCRAKRIQRRYEVIGQTVQFPLLDIPHATTKGILEFYRFQGVVTPNAYDIGLGHNNCSGGCVRAGLGHWARLLRCRPQVYAAREDMERRFNLEVGPRLKRLGVYSILKRFGRPYLLQEFREAIEAGDEPRYAEESDVPNIGMACIECE